MRFSQKGAALIDLHSEHDIIVVGASSGGVEVLRQIVSSLPEDLAAAVFIVVHISPYAPSILPSLLSLAGPIPATHPVDGELIRHGRIYVAPPDRHLVLAYGAVRLSTAPRENHTRPSADPLFRSAARVYGPRVIGVVLSGGLSDGTAGLWEVKERGGIAVVQNPSDALYPSMPRSAIEHVPVDYVLPTEHVGPILAKLVADSAESRRSAPATGAPEGVQAMPAENRPHVDEKPGSDLVNSAMEQQVSNQRDGDVTVYVCPECGGSLWQVNAGKIPRFRCHVGHVYCGDDLLEGYTAEMEKSLWYAIRTLRDKANLTRQLADKARRSNFEESARRYEEAARIDDEHASAIERMLVRVSDADRHAQ